ncbi:MAG: carbohydrate ABC transporter permease [Acetatifactor sp.]
MMRQQKGKRKYLLRLLVYPIIVLLGVCFILPIIFLLSGSITDNIEWQERMTALLMDTKGYIEWRWIPDYPTGEHFKRLLFYTPAFMKLFWNSIKIVGLILVGQLLVGVPGAWGFTAFRFRGRQMLFTLYIILMLLPFQVTMLSKYLVLKEFTLINTHAAVILPAVFSTFPVFLMYRSFTAIPKELLEAARIDGAGEIKTFLFVGLPLAQGGIMAAMVVSFLEAWNMIEEPLAFLQDKALWPLSLYLPEIDIAQAGFSCAASLITLIVSLFVFAIFRDSLEQGILASALKG